MLRRTALLVMAALLTAGLPPARAEDWMEPLPAGAPPNFSWERMTGYWARRDDKDYMLYLSREGMLHSIRWKDVSISSFIGRWKPVRELAVVPPGNLARLVMAADEKFCADRRTEPHPHYRVLELYVLNGRELLHNDFALHVFPPKNPLQTPEDELWRRLRANPEDAAYKDEGVWHHIDERAAPAWFRDQVQRLVHSGRFDCDPGSQNK